MTTGEVFDFEPSEAMLEALRDARNQSACRRRRVSALAIYRDGVAYPGWNVVINGEDCERCPLSKEEVPPDSDYSTPGQRCPALHAEEVAWFYALAGGGEKPDLLAVTERPCPRCEDLLRRIGVPFAVVQI